ncbi:MAG: hypothetical protein H6817_00355 [Phycisphaerales bacterium]|nr:hypothetical protein [Phycisphaerales bacterium]
MANCEKPTGSTGADRDPVLARLVGAELSGDVPQRVVVAPWGEVESTSGAFVVDAEAGDAVVAAFAAHATDLPIDFEHQTLGGAYASPQGTAPAAGWITALAAVAGEGIVATVNWTDEGRRVLASRAYRYLSPVALIRKDDRRLVALHSVALTNKPAIVGMTPVVNDARGAACEDEGAVLAALSQRLALAPDADAHTVLAAAEARLAVMEEAAARRDAEELVIVATATGKLTAAQREWALSLALADRALFDEWLRTAPVVVTVGRTAPPAGGGNARETSNAAHARREYRANRVLQGLTSEDAYVAEALRERLN